jgi:hypothetical protein
MGAQRRVTILLTDEEYEKVKAGAGIASVSAYIKSRLFEVQDGDPGKAVRDDRDVHVVQGGAAVPERPRIRKSEFAESVAERTKHEPGCQCFQCVQAERFFRSQREK